MRYLALALVSLGFAAGAIYQQMHHFDSSGLTIGAFIAFVFVLVPSELTHEFIAWIKRQI